MSNANRLHMKWLMVAFALVAIAVLSTRARAQVVVEDWSSHHLIFSNPGTAEDAYLRGEEERYSRIVNEVRYKQQQLRRSSGTKAFLQTSDGVIKPMAEVLSEASRDKPPADPFSRKGGLKRDWSQSLVASGLVQPNMYPAKWSFSTTTASCTQDFVVYPTGVSTAEIVGFTNLYTTGCSGTVPTVNWAYNLDVVATTSPVISLDGSQVAFMGTTGVSESAVLVLLKWKAGNGTISFPDALSVQSSAANYSTCSAPCYYEVNFNGANDTFSAPFYDYTNDIIYVGDDAGNLHKVTGAFRGTPAATTISLTTYKLGPPVYDPTSGNVFVATASSEAVLYSVKASTFNAANATSSSLGGTGAAIVDAPLVDSAAGKVYVFVSNDTGGHNGVFQFATSFTSGSGTEATVGTGGTEYWLLDGDFDNVYYSSTGGTAGDLWVMGNTGASGGILYRIPIGSGSAMSTPVAMMSGLTNGYEWASPVTEFCNNRGSACTSNGTYTSAGTDYIFFSVYRMSLTNPGGCDNKKNDGCILVYTITNPTTALTTPTGSSPAATVGDPGCWSTGGIIVDNSVPTGTGTGEMTGASQIYTLELNGNTAGWETTYTSSGCTTGNSATPIALQDAQTL